MAIAFTVWLTAPAWTACSSTMPSCLNARQLHRKQSWDSSRARPSGHPCSDLRRRSTHKRCSGAALQSSRARVARCRPDRPRLPLPAGVSLGRRVRRSRRMGGALLQRIRELVGPLPSQPVLLILGAALSGASGPSRRADPRHPGLAGRRQLDGSGARHSWPDPVLRGAGSSCLRHECAVRVKLASSPATCCRTSRPRLSSAELCRPRAPWCSTRLSASSALGFPSRRPAGVPCSRARGASRRWPRRYACCEPDHRCVATIDGAGGFRTATTVTPGLAVLPTPKADLPPWQHGQSGTGSDRLGRRRVRWPRCGRVRVGGIGRPSCLSLGLFV